MMQWQRGQLVEIELTHLVPKGVAFGRLADHRPIFVKGGAPGEVAQVRLTKIKKDFAEGDFVEAVTSSPHRVMAPFAKEALVGADWAHLDYAAQLAGKEGMLRDLLTTVGHLDNPGIEPIVGSDNLWRYRNKIELTFGEDEDGHVRLGFHKPGRFDEIVPTADVALFPEIIQQIIEVFQGWAAAQNLAAYQPRRHTGVLRNLVVRRAEHSPDLLVNLVTTRDPISTDSLLKAVSVLPLTGLVWSQNDSLATIVRVDEMKILLGDRYLTEQFLGQPFRYQVDSFFQTHTSMAEKLAGTVLDRLKDQQAELLIDAYAGVGGFGLFAAAAGTNVISIESHQPSSLDAQTNAKNLGVADKMTFINQPMEDYIGSTKPSTLNPKPGLILDPPRSGLHPKVIKALLTSGIPSIFYVSCGPATLARDLYDLKDVYKPVFIQPFDLFPQTSHLETFVHLKRFS